MKDYCFVFEIGRPVLWKPFKFNSNIMYRIGWLWFAFAIIKMSLYDYSMKANITTKWIGERRKDED